MKKIICVLLLLTAVIFLPAQQMKPATSGNPIVKGWYADPEAAVFGKQYWIYPT